MSRPPKNLSIRTLSLSGLALLGVWYAMLGGAGMLDSAIPVVGTYGPPAVVAGPVDFSENPVGWLVAFASVVADLALLVAIREIRRTRRTGALRAPLTPDDRMWSAHLAWLDECAARRAHARAAKAS
jgi:hypothetical protein